MSPIMRVDDECAFCGAAIQGGVSVLCADCRDTHRVCAACAEDEAAFGDGYTIAAAAA